MGYIEYKKYIDALIKDCANNEVFSYIDSNDKICNYTAHDINDKLNAFKLLLEKNSIKSGDKICLISDNLINSQISFICASYHNICVVLVDPKLPVPQIGNMLSEIDYKLILTDNPTYQRIESIINSKALDITNDFNNLNNKEVNEGQTGDLDEMAIIFSSGTTDIAKPIVLSYDSIINSIKSTTECIINKNSKKILCVLPVYHISGIITCLVALYHNNYVQTVEHFNVLKIDQVFKAFKPNLFVMTPVVIEKMVEKFEVEIKNKSKLLYNVYNTCCSVSLLLKKHLHVNFSFLTKPFSKNLFGNNFAVLVCSASLMTQKVIDRMNSYGIMLINTYASSECGNPITYSDEYFIFDNTVGKITSNPNVSIKLINTNSDGIGNVCVKTNSLMKSYYNDPKLTKESFCEDGYFMSGDLGKIENGYLYIVGKDKESIKLRNGKKLSPNNLEDILETGCPANNKVIIFGYSQNNDGYDDIYAFFKDLNYSDDDKKIIKKKLLDHNKSINSYPIKDVLFINEIPTNTLNKVKRFELAKYITENTVKSIDKTGILEIISKYINVDNGINLNESLNNLGIDSLSMYSIIVDIKEKYNIDITNGLNANTTIQDLINTTSSENTNDLKLRKIRKDEIKELADIAAECFCEYPLYKVFYPDDKTRREYMVYNCWFIMYRRQNYTYISEDKSLSITYKTPKDKTHSLLSIFLNWDFLSYFVKHWKKSVASIKLLISYGGFSHTVMKKYYNPKEDDYIENIFVRNTNQGNGLIFKALSMFDNGRNVYAETHSKENAELYNKMGMDTCETAKWHGVAHYALYRKVNKK